jgi:hypothetical protein
LLQNQRPPFFEFLTFLTASPKYTRKLKALYGRDLTFWGGIDTQRTLPFGSPEEVRAEVRRRTEDLAGNGGFVLAAVHNIRPEWNMGGIAHRKERAHLLL